MKVSDLEGAELDKWVAKAEGYEGPCDAWDLHNLGSAGGQVYTKDEGACKHKKCYAKEAIETAYGIIGGCPEFSSDWSWGGTIIDKLHITICQGKDDDWTIQLWDSDLEWGGYNHDKYKGKAVAWGRGKTFLIAAMRARVASKFGDEVDL